MRVWRTNDLAAASACSAGPWRSCPPARTGRSSGGSSRSHSGCAADPQRRTLPSERNRTRRGRLEAASGPSRLRTSAHSAHADDRQSTRPWRRSPPQWRSRERPRDSRGLAGAEFALRVHWLAGGHEELAAAAERAERHYMASGSSPSGCIGVQAEALYYGAVLSARS